MRALRRSNADQRNGGVLMLRLQVDLTVSFAALHSLLEQDQCVPLATSWAVVYLGDRTLSLTDVACLLGYSEAAAFTPAYKRWTGTAPSLARR